MPVLATIASSDPCGQVCVCAQIPQGGKATCSPHVYLAVTHVQFEGAPALPLIMTVVQEILEEENSPLHC